MEISQNFGYKAPYPIDARSNVDELPRNSTANKDYALGQTTTISEDKIYDNLPYVAGTYYWTNIYSDGNKRDGWR